MKIVEEKEMDIFLETLLKAMSLFLFFKQEEKAGLFAHLAFERSYELTMQQVCRHMLRYLFASLVLSKSPDTLLILHDFVVETEYKYVDEFTAFVKILTQSFTFDALPEALEKIKKVHSLI
jgi:hypothetical protein